MKRLIPLALGAVALLAFAFVQHANEEASGQGPVAQTTTPLPLPVPAPLMTPIPTLTPIPIVTPMPLATTVPSAAQ
jgi:hypothetical protein